MKKLIAILVILVMVATLFAACQQAEAPAAVVEAPAEEP